MESAQVLFFEQIITIMVKNKDKLLSEEIILCSK